MSDLNDSFQKLIDSSWMRYRGCLIERTNDGYLWGNGYYSSLEGAREAIDKEFPLLGNTIRKNNRDEK